MRSYPFINELFTNVLSKSKAIQGRFYICPQNGTEINTDDFNQVIQDIVKREQKKKYPVCIMLPPVSYGDYSHTKGEWVSHRFTLFFLNTSGYSSTNQTMAPNPNTRTTTHTVVQDWHDMARCAISFIQVLGKIQKSLGLINSSFRLDQSSDRTIKPVSGIGADKLAGVRIDFQGSVFIECNTQEDYEANDISAIEVPVEDSHPEHQL